MPLLDDGSEFALKWQALCQSHVDEGIRDPVKVYNYLNRYYVREGNKRVSVLKFFGAGTVYANVARILPERNGSKESELLQNSIRADLCRPFRGKLYAQDGRVMDGDLSAEQIISMDWLVENVVGFIPEYGQLTDLGKATVDMVGVEPATKDRKGWHEDLSRLRCGLQILF